MEAQLHDLIPTPFDRDGLLAPGNPRYSPGLAVGEFMKSERARDKIVVFQSKNTGLRDGTPKSGTFRMKFTFDFIGLFQSPQKVAPLLGSRCKY